MSSDTNNSNMVVNNDEKNLENNDVSMSYVFLCFLAGILTIGPINIFNVWPNSIIFYIVNIAKPFGVLLYIFIIITRKFKVKDRQIIVSIILIILSIFNIVSILYCYYMVEVTQGFECLGYGIDAIVLWLFYYIFVLILFIINIRRDEFIGFFAAVIILITWLCNL